MKHIALMGLALLVIAGCARKEPLLPGTREALRPEVAAQAVAELPALRLPSQQSLAAWPMRAGSATGVMPHAALSAAPALMWTAKIGSGNSRRHRITTDPVAAGGVVYAMDAVAQVTAVSESGAVVWQRDLTPSFEKSGDATGGGLAVSGGVLYATTGYGNLHALDAATGAEQWVQRLDAPITGPTVSNGLIYVVSRDSRAWAIDLKTGRIKWELPGTPSGAVLATSPAPAVNDRLVVFPFGSGELMGVLKQSGIRIWGGTVAGNRRGVAYSNLSDIAADPVIDGNTLYAATPAGRLVSMDVFSGGRNWTTTEGALSPVVPVGGSVYLVSDRAQLLRLDAATGETLWAVPLPFFEARRLDKRKTAFAHFGPVLAGGQLWVGSSDGNLRGFDPETGSETNVLDLKGGAAGRPIVMNDTLYVVSARGTLHAYR